MEPSRWHKGPVLRNKRIPTAACMEQSDKVALYCLLTVTVIDLMLEDA